jgi:hypothetical protein
VRSAQLWKGVVMVAHKWRIAFGVLLVLATAAVGTKIILWRTQADKTLGDKESVPANQRTRHEFARAMGRIKEGMPEKEVYALLGKPDDIRTQNDPGGISTSRTREILIDQAPSYNSGYHYDPLAVIRIVNVLQPLGKDKALTAIDEYLRVASYFHSPAREGLFLVLRVLFDVPADPSHMPHMYVGAPWPAAPEDPKRLPRFPIVLLDDVPLLLVSGYSLGGKAEQPASHVKYFRDNGRLRDRPLAPGNTPLGLLDIFAKSTAWLYADDSESRGKLLIANQLLNMVDSVYRRDTDAYGYRIWATHDLDGRWKSIEAEVAKLNIRWNADKNCFTFKDGSHLAEPIRILYRRQIWKVEGLNGEAAVVLERTNKHHVGVSLEWSGKKDQEMPPFVLKVFAVKNKANTLAELRRVSISAVAGDQAFSSQSFEVDLADGAEIQVQVEIGKREELSPVYRP